MYDNICKYLAEKFPDALATWLLGYPVELTILSPKELSLEPIRADSIILQQSEDLVLHCEFQTLPKPDIPFRMLDYRVRVYRRFPNKRMMQVVVYLTRTESELAYQNYFNLEETNHRFRVVRLWEQPTEQFLQTPGLLPFAVLSRTDNRIQVLNQVAQAVDRITNQQEQSSIAAASAILAGLVLKEDTIKQILRRDIMRESVIYQEILREGEQIGRREGEQIGRREGEQIGRREGEQIGRREGEQIGRREGEQIGRREGEQIAKTEIALNLLREGITVDLVVKFTGLGVEVVENLAREITDN